MIFLKCTFSDNSCASHGIPSLRGNLPGHSTSKTIEIYSHLLDDVGFGYSQILPIITAIEGSGTHYDRTILIEQPELHLHPQFQSRLARILSNVFTRPEYDIQTNNQIIIETHSEQIVRGFLIELLLSHI